jgi:hypothetical protein
MFLEIFHKSFEPLSYPLFGVYGILPYNIMYVLLEIDIVAAAFLEVLSTFGLYSLFHIPDVGAAFC